jgi:serine O-acetyltransferase
VGAAERRSGRSSVRESLQSASANPLSIRTLIWAVRGAIALPLYLAARACPAREAVRRDMLRFAQPRLDLALPETLTWRQTVQALRHRPLRSVLYVRLRGAGLSWGVLARALAAVYRGAPALEISCGDIGPGMFSFHGFATIIIAQSIGRDFLFAQQVTVGYDDRGGTPTIGDRVRIGAGAIVIGPITIGDDAVIGAGAVVVKDVPAATVVAGVPARPIEHAADRFSARKASSSSPSP